MAGGDPRAEERVGSVLHEKWTLERLLGVGGMGAVYAARHRNGARAAVKVLSAAMGRLPHIRKRFLHEGYAANRVEHPGAVRVLDDDVIPDGTDEGTAYLVMELLEGESLSERVKREPPLGERDLLEIADGVLAVLDAAHRNGVVHRDLKPDNLFLARDPERPGTQIKVLDFGLARLLDAAETTIAGMALGTPTYMSPEQAGGQVDRIDGRTDIYALGSILFQLASNRRIHDAAHTLGLVVRMATTPAPKLKSVAPDVSSDLARIVDRALEFERDARYPNAAAMRADVQAALAAMSAGTSTSSVLASSSASSSEKLGRADTMPAEVITVAAAPEALASELRRAEAKPEQAVEPRRGSAAWRVVVVFGVALAALLGWKYRATVEAGLAAKGTAVASPSSAPSIAPSTEPSQEPATTTDASDDAGADTLDEAGSAIPLEDAAAAEDLGDASADAGEDEDDDDDDDLDAAVEASAPASMPSARRTHHPSSKPPKKRPARPGQPRKKKRWHW